MSNLQWITLLGLALGLSSCTGEDGAAAQGNQPGARGTARSGSSPERGGSAPPQPSPASPTSSGENNEDSALGMGFVLLSKPELPRQSDLLKNAGLVGIKLRPDPGWYGEDGPDGDAETTAGYLLDDGRKLVLLRADMPHPDAPHLCGGLFPPDENTAVAAPSHWILSLSGGAKNPMEQDITMARLTWACMASGPAIAGMLGHGANFIKADAFAAFAGPGNIEHKPLVVMVELSIAGEGEGRASMLTYNMPRYGQKDLLLETPAEGEMLDQALWFYSIIDYQLQTPGGTFGAGETIGGAEDQKLPITEKPNPADPKQTVLAIRVP